MINSLNALDEVANRDFSSATNIRDEACYRWDSLSPQERQNNINVIKTHFDNFQHILGRIIATLTTHINERSFGDLDYLIPNLQSRLDLAKADLESSTEYFNSHPGMAQTLGDKIRRTKVTPAPESSLYKLCQTQVLPPEPSWPSDFLADASRGMPDIMRDLPRFQEEPGAGTWTPKELQGGQATTTLWICAKSDGNVTRRIVVKDIIVDEATAELSEQRFKDPRNWHGDTSAFAVDNNHVPMEFHTQQIVSTAPGFFHGVKFLARPQIMWQDRKIRLYMEHVPKGDADKLAKNHKDSDEPVPETFLWLCFQALIKTALVMERGYLEEDEEDQPAEWSQIVHCDFKPGNLFLGLPKPNFYPLYPTPKYVLDKRIVQRLLTD